jgi:hypothetical protein
MDALAVPSWACPGPLAVMEWILICSMRGAVQARRTPVDVTTCGLSVVDCSVLNFISVPFAIFIFPSIANYLTNIKPG